MRLGESTGVLALLTLVPQLEMQPFVSFFAVPGALWSCVSGTELGTWLNGEYSPAGHRGVGTKFGSDAALAPDIATGVEGTRV